jgi:hypothetical protein
MMPSWRPGSGSAYFGDLRSDPRFLVCHGAACYRRIGGGGEKGKTIRHTVIAVSRDARYLPCPVDYAGALQRVRDHSSDGQDFYRDSACVADRWVTEHGGKPAVLDLITRLNHGDKFTAVVTPH